MSARSQADLAIRLIKHHGVIEDSGRLLSQQYDLCFAHGGDDVRGIIIHIAVEDDVLRRAMEQQPRAYDMLQKVNKLRANAAALAAESQHDLFLSTQPRLL